MSCLGRVALGTWLWAYGFGHMALGIWLWAYDFGRMNLGVCIEGEATTHHIHNSSATVLHYPVKSKNA